MSARGSGLVYAALAAVILIWGTTWAAIRIGLAGVPPFAGVSIRFALAALLLFVASRLLRIAWQGGRRLRWIWATQTVFAFCISYGVVYWAEQWVPSGLTAILFSTFPLFVAVLAHFFLADERLTPAAVVGVLVGFAGVALIFSDDLGALAGRRVQVRLARHASVAPGGGDQQCDPEALGRRHPSGEPDCGANGRNGVSHGCRVRRARAR